MGNCSTEPQLYQTGQTGRECVSVLTLDMFILKSSKSRFQDWTGSINLSILCFSMVFKAVGLHVTSWGRRVAREERSANELG